MDNVFIDILHRVEKYLLEIPQSPTSLRMDNVCRYFTESCKIFTRNAIITDVYTIGYSLSVFVGAVHNYRQTHRRTVRISKVGH